MTHLRVKLTCLCLAAVLALSGCAESQKQQEDTTELSTVETEPTQAATEPVDNLVCLDISRFTGGYVEDGSYEQVKDVAAILVSNETNRFLELATVTYMVGERTATFRITGLPAGGKVWVLEQNRMTLSDGDELVFLDCESSYNSNAIVATGDLSVSREGNNLTVTNVSGKTLKNVCVYYKNKLASDVFMGGITFMVVFGELEPGATLTRASAHLGDNSQIVRYSYQSE